jgi:hypothetical protein
LPPALVAKAQEGELSLEEVQGATRPMRERRGAQAAAVQITDAHTRMKSRGWFEQLMMRLVVRPAPRFRGWLFRGAMVLLEWAVDPQSTDGFFDGWHLFRPLAGCSGVGTLFDRSGAGTLFGRWRVVRWVAACKAPVGEQAPSVGAGWGCWSGWKWGRYLGRRSFRLVGRGTTQGVLDASR